MQAFTVLFALLATAMAAPATLEVRGGHSVCSKELIHSVPQCCATNILDIADLDCYTPHKNPRNGEHFAELCAEKGAAARCCTLPIANQALICGKPIGA